VPEDDEPEQFLLFPDAELPPLGVRCLASSVGELLQLYSLRWFSFADYQRDTGRGAHGEQVDPKTLERRWNRLRVALVDHAAPFEDRTTDAEGEAHNKLLMRFTRETLAWREGVLPARADERFVDEDDREDHGEFLADDDSEAARALWRELEDRLFGDDDL